MTKLAYNQRLKRYAITNLGVVQDSDTELATLMSRNGMLDTTSDVLDTTEEEAQEAKDAQLEAYIQKQISRIPQHGDDCLWRIASACDLFEDLSPDGSLTPYQKEKLEAFVASVKADGGLQWYHF